MTARRSGPWRRYTSLAVARAPPRPLKGDTACELLGHNLARRTYANSRRKSVGWQPRTASECLHAILRRPALRRLILAGVLLAGCAGARSSSPQPPPASSTAPVAATAPAAPTTHPAARAWGRELHVAETSL